MSVARLTDRVLSMLGFARVARALSPAGKIGRLQVTANRVDDEHDHHQPYGFQARPKAGATAVTLDAGGSADARLVILVGDRRYTLALAEGEVAIADDLGQKVHLTRTGIVVGASLVELGQAGLGALDGVVHGSGIDPFTGLTYAALGNTSAVVKAKK